MNHLRRTADEKTGDVKVELKQLGDQWPLRPWREHGSVCVSPVAGQP